MENTELEKLLIDLSERITRLETCFKNYVKEQSSKTATQKERVLTAIAVLATGIAVIELIVLR